MRVISQREKQSRGEKQVWREGAPAAEIEHQSGARMESGQKKGLINLASTRRLRHILQMEQ